MNLAILALLSLLAQLSKWKRLGDGLRQTGEHRDLVDLWPIPLFGGLAAGAVYAIVVWRRRNDFTRRCNDPEKLFRELCQTHELEKDDRLLLRQLAEACGLAQPALVFLQPEAFTRGELPEALQPRAAQLNELQRRIF